MSAFDNRSKDDLEMEIRNFLEENTIEDLLEVVNWCIKNKEEDMLELSKLYYGMSESMQRAIKEIMIVTQEKKDNDN